MKNTLGDLNNYLFEQLERLTDDKLTDEGLNKELQRTKAVTSVAETVIHNSRLALEVIQTVQDYDLGLEKGFIVPPMLEAKTK